MSDFQHNRRGFKHVETGPPGLQVARAWHFHCAVRTVLRLNVIHESQSPLEANPERPPHTEVRVGGKTSFQLPGKPRGLLVGRVGVF